MALNGTEKLIWSSLVNFLIINYEELDKNLLRKLQKGDPGWAERKIQNKNLENEGFPGEFFQRERKFSLVIVVIIPDDDGGDGGSFFVVRPLPLFCFI